MRLLPIGLAACTPAVTVHTQGTEQAPVAVFVHDAFGEEVARVDAAGSVEVEVPRGGSVSAMVWRGAGTALAQTVAAPRAGDGLAFDLLPDGLVAELGPELRLVLDAALPERAAYAWVGLYECAAGRTEGEGFAVALSPCAGAVTPVAVALDASARPLAYLALPAEEADALAGEERVLAGAWREDWRGVQLAVDARGEVFAQLRYGGWLDYTVLPGSGTASFLIPAPIAAPGRLELGGRDGEARVTWSAVVASGEALAVDLADAPAVEGAALIADGGLWRVEAETEARALFVEATSQVDGVVHSWQARLPVDGALPAGFVDAAGLADGRVDVGFADLPWRALRERGESEAAMHVRYPVVALP